MKRKNSWVPSMRKDNLFIISIRHHNLFLCIHSDATSYIQVIYVLNSEQWTVKRTSATTRCVVVVFGIRVLSFFVPHSHCVFCVCRFVFIPILLLSMKHFISRLSRFSVCNWSTKMVPSVLENSSGQWCVVDGRGNAGNDEIVFFCHMMKE